MLDLILANLPLWLVALLLLAACVIAREIGSLACRALKARSSGSQAAASSDAESHIIGAVFGLLSFIVALTFSLALDRHSGRGALVTEEANAIGSAFLSAGLLDEPHRSRLRSTLRAYARTRVAGHGVWDPKAYAQLAQGRALRDELWRETETAVAPIRSTDQASYYLGLVNQVLDVGARRELAGRAHIPTRIVGILFLYLVAASAVMGYLLGPQPGLKRQATTALLLLFTVIIVTIVDLDRPRSGAIRVPQQPLLDLLPMLDDGRLRAGAAAATSEGVEKPGVRA